ncbi:hypothetical protein ACFQW6_00730 [Nocardioides sp. GCM10028917]|uniref:hypothetical protein n=1 Tax=Nocardioides sp. GCM10028917 TaxID=3273408 RepID=UPI0036175783
MGSKDGAFGRETLAERVANTRARQMSSATSGHSTADLHGKRPNAPAPWAAPPPGPASPGPPPPSIKHCWYDGPYGRQPALLLRWRRIAGDHYDGLIIVAAPDETGTSWVVMEMWAEASLLSPA